MTDASADVSTDDAGTTQDIAHLPLQDFGYENLPAVPVQLRQMIETVGLLAARYMEIEQAVASLTTRYTIDGRTAHGYQFCFGRSQSNIRAARQAALQKMVDQLESESERSIVKLLMTALGEGSTYPEMPDSLTELFLDQPEQWTMAWTTMPGVFQEGQPFIPAWSAALTDADRASAELWPIIARYGLPYNLLMLEKVTEARAADLRVQFESLWTPELDERVAAGKLYIIDMSIFESVEPVTVNGFERFTPATLTLLEQDPETKALLPVAVRVCGQHGDGAQLYSRQTGTDGAWLYALQAVKTSVTVFGIWLGHVYPWHLVSGAMQMTMYNNIPSGHPIYQLLEPQSEYLIPLDDLFFLLWPHLTPPTSIHSTATFLSLANVYGEGRGFFEDDPLTTLERLELDVADFSVDQPWDQYPLVAQMLELWQASEAFVETFVTTTYADDQAVVDDPDLQAWMSASSKASEGNVQGLPAMDSRAALQQVLTSLVYRINVHGTARLSRAANPGLTWVANFPPCLQDTTIPEPTAELDTRALMRFLPNTGTIGAMIDFYYVFSYSVPYESLVPTGGLDDELYFSGGLESPLNQALIQFRTAAMDFADQYDPTCPQYYQWPRNVET